MKHFISFIALFVVLTFNPAFAQGEAAIPFLYVTPSSQFTGLGWTGVSVPNDDAFGFHYNPAMIGYFGQRNNLSIQMYPGETDWIFGINVNSYALNAGYNFKNELNGLNLSGGAGFIRNRFSFGPENYDSYNAYVFGVGIDYYITLSAGITFKNIHSQISRFISPEETAIARADANAIDYGFLLSLPILDLFDNTSIEFFDSRIIPDFDYSIGYSRLNIGDEVYYFDPDQFDPLPLTARLGHTISLGLDYQTDNILINMLDYDLILEADDILVSREFDPETLQFGDIKYDGMLGEIDFFDNLIRLKSNDNVVIHKGHSIRFVETVTILSGSFSGRGYERGIKTNGLIISSLGFFKWLGAISGDNILRFIANHIELRYVSSSIFEGESIETDLSGLSLSFFNYSFN